MIPPSRSRDDTDHKEVDAMSTSVPRVSVVMSVYNGLSC